MNRKFFILILISVSFIGISYFLNSKKSQKQVLKNYPEYIQIAFSNSELKSDLYEDEIKEMNLTEKENMTIGKRLYQEAMGNSMYSKDKIKLLKMAKSHLLVAKGMNL